MTLLLGQEAPCPRPTVTSLTKAAWAARVAASRALVDRAFPQADALELLRRRPDTLEDVVTSEASWVNCGGERSTRVDLVRGLLHPTVEGRRERGAYAHLLEGVPPSRVTRSSR